MKYALLFMAVLAACSSDDGGSSVQKDAAGSGSGSGSVNKVTTVSCTGATVAATVTTTDGQMKYTYSTGTTAPSIAAGGIVEFKTSSTHDVNPSITSGFPSDPGVKVGFSADTCLKLLTAGDFNFYCSLHGFTGKITVN